MRLWASRLETHEHYKQRLSFAHSEPVHDPTATAHSLTPGPGKLVKEKQLLKCLLTESIYNQDFFFNSCLGPD